MVSTMTVEKSTHIVEVLRVNELLPCENADRLVKVKIYDYVSLVQKELWKEGDLAAWIPPDSVVDVSLPEFSFLYKKAKNGKIRIRTEKMRGIVSYGLLVKAPEGSKIGDNVADILKVEHWEAEVEGNSLTRGGEVAKSPSGTFPVYDVDSFLRHGRSVFIEGEPVSVTEKLNGESSKFVYKDGEMYVGSRGQWKREFPTKPTITYEQLLANMGGNEVNAKNIGRKIENWTPKKNHWWTALENCPNVRKFCEANPGFALYGEIYGHVGGDKPNWSYGVVKKPIFAAFDILKPDGSWFDFPDFLWMCKKYDVPTVPVIHESIPFQFEQLVTMADRSSVISGSNCIAEGVVVAPIKERWDEKVGRVKFKIINPNY